MQLLGLLLESSRKMHKELNKPIFAVGSGTSILIWCPARSTYVENQTQTLFDVFTRRLIDRPVDEMALGTGLICSKTRSALPVYSEALCRAAAIFP